MLEQLEVLRMAGALAQNAEARQQAIAKNVANADTPGYRAVDVPSFADTYAAADGLAMRATQPGHITAIQETVAAVPKAIARPGSESPDGNTVTLEQQMVAATQVKQQHDMALAIYRKATGMLRIALGVAK